MTTAFCLALLAVSQSPPAVDLDPQTGTYTVTGPEQSERFVGRVPGPVSAVRRGEGKDHIGRYTEVSFEWSEGGPVRGTIRRYRNRSAFWFGLRYLEARPGNGVVFPNFTEFPTDVETLSFHDGAFAPPSNRLEQTSTPWLFFIPRGPAFVFSPASAFLVAKMSGNLETSIGEGLNVRLTEVPQGLEQDSLLAFGGGVGDVWKTWGGALRALYGRPDVRYDADVLLRWFGYWTDNGADYYYNYDRSLGYAGTLLAVRKRYEEEGIPLGYLQLDSWWYSKTTNDPAGKPGGAKNKQLPEVSWNRYGGLWEYRAHPDLFPQGLDGFRAQLGLPLAVHNRWIDRQSPYHERYAISGVGAVDSKWWTDVAAYVKSGGVACYEQDWLSTIYANSPEMASKVGVGDAFADGMASAMNRAGLTMQYCMATPRFYLQGVKYPNLTTIRTSGDRFEPRKWANFLMVSQLAVATGIAPWCDVFKSAETGNMILSVLSCGPVGTGDALGKEDVSNIHRACTADGTIVKPDQAALPTDETYAGGPAFVASTFTDHAAMRTTYVFAFPRVARTSEARFTPASLGLKGEVYVLDLVAKAGRLVRAEDEIEAPFNGPGYTYLSLTPATAQGIVLLGDLDKFVPTGRARILYVRAQSGGLRVFVRFARGERMVVLSGVSLSRPAVRSLAGSASVTGFSAADGRFEVEAAPAADGRTAEVWIGRAPAPGR